MYETNDLSMALQACPKGCSTNHRGMEFHVSNHHRVLLVVL
jgi:hypothetical protein